MAKRTTKKISPRGRKVKASGKAMDLIVNPTVAAEKAGEMSRIFPQELVSRMSNLMGTGLDKMGRSLSKLTVANPNHPLALPSLGDASLFPAAGIHSGLSVQGGQGKKGKDGQTVTAALEVKAANVTMMQPFFHTPGNAQDAYNLPKSYVEQVRWSRLMYNLNPYVHSITELKAFYPYSKFKLSTPEPFVTDFYEGCAFNKGFNLYRFILRMSLSLKKFGEAIVWGARKQDGVWPQTGQPRWVWDYFILLEPELVEVKKSLIGNPEPQYFLRPNRDLEELARMIQNNAPEVAHLQGKVAQPILDKIFKRELIPMDASTISSIQNLTDGSATRGTPPMQDLFVNFIFEDFVRLALMAQAQRYHFPIEVWTLGNLEKGILPGVADLEKLRDLVTNALQTPPFTIFFPPIIEYKAYGVDGQLLDIQKSMEYAHKQYMIGMGVNENIIMGESGIFSSNETAGNQTFIRLMQKDRDEMEEWMRWHFFEPLAQWNNLKQNKNGVLTPIVPEIEWAKTLDFKAEEDERERLKYGFEQGLVDPETFTMAYMNRNPEEMKVKIAKALGGILDNGKRYGNEALRKKIASTGEPEGGGGGGGVSAPGAPAGGPGAPEEAPGGPESAGEGGAPTPTPAAEAPAAAGGGEPTAPSGPELPAAGVL